MRNTMKKKLLAGEIVVGTQLRFGSSAIAELFGHAGFDFLVFDSEHAPQTPVGLQHQIQAALATPAIPFVRLVRNDPILMRPYLDAGALGIVAPFVTTAEEAREGADGLRYPPRGTRGYGPAGASKYGLDTDYFETADEDMFYLPIIEDAEAVRNIDEIFAVEDLDSVLIGPADLSISLGVPMQFDHPSFKDAVDTVAKAGRTAGKPLGTAVYGGDILNPDTYTRFVDQGFTLFLAGGDEWMLQAACQRLMDCLKEVNARAG